MLTIWWHPQQRSVEASNCSNSNLLFSSSQLNSWLTSTVNKSSNSLSKLWPLFLSQPLPLLPRWISRLYSSNSLQLKPRSRFSNLLQLKLCRRFSNSSRRCSLSNYSTLSLPWLSRSSLRLLSQPSQQCNSKSNNRCSSPLLQVVSPKNSLPKHLLPSQAPSRLNRSRKMRKMS